jgi:hypothetical protein
MPEGVIVEIPPGAYTVKVTIADVSDEQDGSHLREAYFSLLILDRAFASLVQRSTPARPLRRRISSTASLLMRVPSRSSMKRALGRSRRTETYMSTYSILDARIQLGIPAKLSRKADKCRDCDAERQTDRNMQVETRCRHNILVLAQGIEP